jgi:hypothetical protein
MNTRVFVAVSLLLNAALLVLALRMGRTSTATGDDSVASATSAAGEVLEVKTNLMRVEVTLTNEATPFRWSDVQSEDLRAYAANLRGIGCPPETVRDIIEGEANEWFLTRRRAALEPLQRGYWDLAASGKELDKATEPFGEAVEKLEEEREQRLKDALGEVSERKPTTSRSQRLDYVSEATQKAMEDINAKFNLEFNSARLGKDGRPNPNFQAARDKLEAWRKEALHAVMTPEEYTEYEARKSRYARTAQSSVGFEATEEEQRTTARIYQQFEAADARLDRKDPDATAKKAQAAEAKRQREEAMKQALGEERYAQFQQGMQGDFGSIYPIAKRYELPRESAAQAADALKMRNAAISRLRADKSMSGQERAARELAVKQETRAAMLQALGERALRTYEKYHGPLVPAR